MNDSYVKQYRTLDDQASSAESKADEYRARADQNRWEQCRIAHEATTEGGYSVSAFAREVGRSQGHLSIQRKIWQEYCDPNTRPTYTEAYGLVKGNPTGPGALKPKVLSGFRNLPPEEKAAAVAEAIADNPEIREAATRAVVSNPAGRRDVWDALDNEYENTPKPVAKPASDTRDRQLELVLEFRRVHQAMHRLLDLAADPNAIVSDEERDAALEEIRWLRNALEMVEIGLTAKPLHEAVSDFLSQEV